MKLELILSQGRVADKTAQTIKGAALTAKMLEHEYGVTGKSIGTFSPPAEDDWRVSLPQAKETLTQLGQAIASSIKAGSQTIMASNTCSASLASLPVVAAHHPDTVVLWCDAHGDFNTPETTDSGYLGGMVVAAVCGLWDSGHGSGLKPEQVILVGAHDIDEQERKLLKEAGVRIIAPKDVTAENVLKEINGADVWVHVDWDVLEPGYVPADYEVTGGIVPAQLESVFKAIPSDKVLGLEMAEFKSSLDTAANEKPLSIISDIAKALLTCS